MPFPRAARLCLTLFLASCSLLIANAQAPKTYTSSEILLGLKKLNVLGSVLYIAAHPDDENTRLIAYLANGRLVETGYLSCTRGDGGQNLIGPELREQLGVIRTQELLAARRIDGGRQFFTRANDFGFSKTPEETFTIWDKEQVLADMVWVIRQRRPDVLITRFPPDARAGHGHHTASAMLAAEAFDAAGDPKRFPEQLQYVQPWQPKRLLWNTGSFFVKSGEDMSGYLKLDAGGYNPLLGQSYGEIAARSRSQHKSQGFGSAATRGEALEYFQLVKGEKVAADLFEGVDMTWNRVPGGAVVGKLVDEVIRKYDASNPSASVAGLLKVRTIIDRWRVDLEDKTAPVKEPELRTSDQIDAEYWDEDSVVPGGPKSRTPTLSEAEIIFWKNEKLSQIELLIQACLGLYLEATTNAPTMAPGQPIGITVQGVNRSPLQVAVGPMTALGFREEKDTTWLVMPNKTFSYSFTPKLPSKVEVTQPYWLLEPGTVGMYKVPNRIIVGQARYSEPVFIRFRNLIGTPTNPRAPLLSVMLSVKNEPGNGGGFFSVEIPVQYKSTDPVEGEKYRPLTIVPPVAVNIGGHAYVFADNQPKTVPVTLRAGKAGVKGSVALALPAGWLAEPASIPFELAAKDAEETVQFRVHPGPGAAAGKADLRATATVDGQPYSRGYQVIQYNHIPTQTLFPEAVAPLVKLDLRRKGQQVGYLMGAGDDVPDALRQLGYSVTLLKTDDLTPDNLRRFDAVVLGIRAYNTLDRLKTQQPNLLKYVENGGNLIVQYTVNRGTVLPEIGPYPMKLSTDRVTVENAPVTFLKPQHPLLNVPNKLTAQDFEGWQQEQGLYYPSQWDPKYQTIISSQDPGEKPKESAILVADYGKGHYIYTGLSFFRELPAGVPGAYRLLTNMISLGK
ncbi:N-acetylglucosaminyl deacetylase, LmbE family [Hymenobacter daecheongensis DSM 21074]|uniref:N-acetylglucosaminyl deacetylase, LmbE family n=1 Tax=Hymenobacter daecheongensis DSM 21074 TaxID=1121955 RepID=A0A1M6LRJ9_9BACT|nr:PIG-L family deacetylase [Hymenobacter daecheongensis]SHJ73732.1 N-acetylglucosaminyl deacetylase, LmbE family [Hymenobacter daecheongensis DSM 21074]